MSLTSFQFHFFYHTDRGLGGELTHELVYNMATTSRISLQHNLINHDLQDKNLVDSLGQASDTDDSSARLILFNPCEV